MYHFATGVVNKIMFTSKIGKHFLNNFKMSLKLFKQYNCLSRPKVLYSTNMKCETKPNIFVLR